MKFDKLKLFTYINRLVLLVFFIGMVVIEGAARGSIGKDILFVYPDRYFSDYYFSHKTIEDLTAEDYEGLLSFEGYGDVTAETFLVEKKTPVIYTNHAYFYVNPASFIVGGPWGEEEDKERVIILNESLAWMLFGNAQALGLYVDIDEESYRVVGVVKDGEVAKENCFAYLPYEFAGEDTGISTLMLKATAYNLMLSQFAVTDLLTTLGAEEDYNITDMNRYLDGFSIRYQLVIFIFSMLFAWDIIYYNYRLKKDSHREFQKNAVYYGLLLLCLVVMTMIIGRFMNTLWAPSGEESILKHLYQTVSNANSLPQDAYLSRTLLAVKKLNGKGNLCLVGALACSINLALIRVLPNQIKLLERKSKNGGTKLTKC